MLAEIDLLIRQGLMGGISNFVIWLRNSIKVALRNEVVSDGLVQGM